MPEWKSARTYTTHNEIQLYYTITYSLLNTKYPCARFLVRQSFPLSLHVFFPLYASNALWAACHAYTQYNMFLFRFCWRSDRSTGISPVPYNRLPHSYWPYVMRLQLFVNSNHFIWSLFIIHSIIWFYSLPRRPTLVSHRCCKLCKVLESKRSQSKTKRISMVCVECVKWTDTIRTPHGLTHISTSGLDEWVFEHRFLFARYSVLTVFVYRMSMCACVCVAAYCMFSMLVASFDVPGMCVYNTCNV